MPPDQTSTQTFVTAERVPGKGRGRGLSEAKVVAAARELLVVGGPERVVVREVARRLGVAPSSLYKHVQGREDVLTLLIAECWAELASAVQQSVDGAAADEHRTRLRAATYGFRRWALAHPAEYQLILGYPLREYAAPPGGPTDAAGRSLGEAFFAVYDRARRAGRLRTPVEPPPARGVIEVLSAGSAWEAVGFSPDEMYLFVMGFQRLQGLVSFEVARQQIAGIGDHAAYVLDQIERLLAEVLTPGP